MRVIAGNFRGRRIKTLPGKNTRPTLDKVKESVFNILGQYFVGGSCLDLFSGSGNLGIEALSRGCETCVFVEQNYKAYQVIKENINALNLENKTEIFRMDAYKALGVLEKNGYKFDYVFLDPPYYNQKINKVLEILVNNNLLSNNAKVIVECLKEDETLTSYLDLKLEKINYYGITKISIYKKYGDKGE